VKRVALIAAVVIALLFWLAAGNKRAFNARERRAPAAGATSRPAVSGAAITGPPLSGAALSEPAVPASGRAPAVPPSSSASPAAALELKPPPGKSISAPPPEPGADDPGPGPYIERYQGRSGRLSPNATPGGGEVTTHIRANGGIPALTIWVPTIRIQAGAEVAIHATLTDEQGNAVAPDSLVAAIARRGKTPGAEQPLAPEAGGYALRFKAPAPDAPSAAPAIFDYVVQARGQYRGEPFARTATGSFLVHSTGGRLDAGAARVERRGGDLVLEVPASLDRAGTYWMYAELWGGRDFAIPIAFARDRFERLPEGDRSLSISFGGAVLRDSGLDGPYLIRNLRFQQVDAFPPQEAEPIAQLPPTAAFRAAEFN
jgi:hypothetical protein